MTEQITSENLWEIVKDIVRKDAERILAEAEEAKNV